MSSQKSYVHNLISWWVSCFIGPQGTVSIKKHTFGQREKICKFETFLRNHFSTNQINQSIRIFLKWPKWNSHCKDYTWKWLEFSTHLKIFWLTFRLQRYDCWHLLYCIVIAYFSCSPASYDWTSGQSNLTQGRIAAADGRFSRTRQVAPMCPPMWAHWRHLANMTELVLPSAHPSPQRKRQIDWFSHFCTAHGRMSLYYKRPFPPKYPILMEGSGPI